MCIYVYIRLHTDGEIANPAGHPRLMRPPARNASENRCC